METRLLKDKEERLNLFTEAGIDLTQDIAISCSGGITASVVYGSLKDIATGNVSLFDGSWSEYSKNKKSLQNEDEKGDDDKGGFPTVVVIIIIILLAIAAGGYVCYKKRKQAGGGQFMTG